MKNCSHCGLYLPDEAFNWRYQLLGIRHKTCRNCQNEYQRSWYQKNKDVHLANVQTRKVNARQEARQFVQQYLSAHACIECGERDPLVLEFHHLKGKDKAISVMIAGGYPIATIRKEIAKCVVLCANCHRRKTAKQNGWYRGA